MDPDHLSEAARQKRAKRHFGVLAALLLLVVPVWQVDRTVLAPTGGDWISLDFRGLLVIAYLLLWALFALVSTFRLFWAPALPGARYYVTSGLIVALIVGLGIGVLNLFQS